MSNQANVKLKCTLDSQSASPRRVPRTRQAGSSTLSGPEFKAPPNRYVAQLIKPMNALAL